MKPFPIIEKIIANIEKNNKLLGDFLLFIGVIETYLLVVLASNMLGSTTPFLSVGLSFLWFMLPGMILASAIHQNCSWWERIPLSFALSIALITPFTILAILLHLSLTVLLIFHFITLVFALVILMVARKRQGRTAKNLSIKDKISSSIRFDVPSLVLLVVIIAIVGSMMFLALSWPMTGDDIAGMAIFAEVLNQNRITGTEPFHGSGTPVTPRNELIVATYLEILINRISGESPSVFIINSRVILVLLAMLSLAMLLNQFLKDQRLCLFLLCIWGIYLLATVQEDGIGSDFITRIFQDKFLGWYVIVPIVVVFMLWFLESRNKQILIEFIFLTLAASLVHPITLVQVMILIGGFGIVHFLAERTRKVFITLFIVAMVLLISTSIPFLEYLRYSSIMPIQLAGLGDAVEFGRLSAAVIRYRLWLLEGDRFVLHPATITQPIILLAYVLLPLIILKLRVNKVLQLIVGVLLLLPILLYIPPFAALVGLVVTPYLMWRLAWPLPLFAILSIGWVVWSLARSVENRIPNPTHRSVIRGILYPGLILVIFLLALPALKTSLRDYQERLSEIDLSTCIKSEGVMRFLEDHSIHRPINVLSSHDLNFCIPGYVANANVVEYRGYGTINRLPLDEIDDSIQRVEDVFYFDNAKLVDGQVMNTILQRKIDFVLVDKNKLSLDLQFHLLPGFDCVYEDADFRLYYVKDPASSQKIIQANTALSSKRYEAAKELFEQVMAEEPANALAYVGLGLAEDGLGDSEQAITAYEEAIRRVPDESALHAQLAGTYLVMRDSASAVHEYELAIELSRERPSLYNALGNLYLLLDRDQEALDSFKKAASLMALEGTASYYTILGRSLQYIGRMSEEAIQYHGIAISIQSDPSRFIDLARAYIYSGQTDKAIEMLKQSIVMDRWNYLPHLELGFIYMKDDRLDDAIREFKTACRLDPANISAYISLAVVLNKQYGLDVAISQMDGMKKLNKLLPGPYRGTAVLMASSGELDSALQALNVSETIQPRSGSILTTKGYISMIAEQMDNAYDAFNDALSKYPDLISAQLGLGIYYRFEANYPMETGQLLQIARLVPTASWIHSALAETYLNQGDWQAAIDESNWAINIDPEDPSGYLARGAIYTKQYQWERAIADYSKVCELDPEDIVAWLGLGDIYRDLADYAKAEILYQHAADINQDSIDPKIRLANMYWQLGRTAEATTLEDTMASMQSGTKLVLLRTANSLQMQGKRDEATTAYYEVIDTNPEAISAYIALAQLLEEDNDITMLYSLYRDMLIANPGSAEAYLASGKFYQARDQFEVSDQIYKQSLALPNVSIDNYLALYELQSRRGQDGAALQTLENAIRVFPGEATGFNTLGEYYLNLGEIDQAEGYFNQAMQIDPGLISAYAGKSKIAQIRGDMGAAETALQDAILTNPGSAGAILDLADFQETAGKLDLAEENVQKALAINPNDVDSCLAAASFYMRQDRYDEAQQILQNALSLPEANMDVNLLMGDLQMGRMDTAEAMRWYQAAHLVDKSVARPYLAMASLDQASGEYDRAASMLGEALRVEPTSIDVNLAFGELYDKIGRADDARHYFERARKFDQSNINPLIALAEHLKGHNPEEAIKYLKQAIDMQPTNFVAYSDLAQIYQAMGDHSKAEEILSQGLHNTSDKQTAYLSIARLCETLGLWDKAQEWYTVAWQQAPDLQSAGINLVKFLHSRFEDEQALTVLTQLEKKFTTDPEIYTAYGDIYASQARWWEAIDAYRRAIESGPHIRAAYISLGNIYAQQGKPQAAIDLFQDALEQGNDVEVLISLGLALRDQSRYQEAQEIFQQALDLAPFNSICLINIEQLSQILNQPQMDLLSYAQRALLVPSSTAFTTIAQIYQMRGEWNAAHSWYHRAILLEPENSTNWVYLGNYYQSLAKWDLALDAYQQAQKYGPASSAISLALGNVQEKLGRFEDAMGSYQRSIEMDPGSMDAYISLAELQLNQNDSENALATIQAGIVKVPGDYRGYMTLGEVYETIDPENVTQIEMAYQAGLDILPGESALYVRIGDLYTQRVFSAWVNLKEAGELANLSQNRYTAMLNHFGIVNEDLSQQSPFVQDTIIEQRLIVDRYKQNLGVAQAAFKETDVDFGVADSNYLKALELEPNDGLALLGLGRLQITRDAQDVAQAYFEQANAYNPSSSTLLTHLGMLYQDVGWTEQAVHVFEQLKKIEPSNISAQAGLLEGYRNLASLTVTQASQAVEERAYTLGSLVNFLRDRETQPSR